MLLDSCHYSRVTHLVNAIIGSIVGIGFGFKLNCHVPVSCSSEKDQLVEEDEDELKEVLDLRKIAVQLLQQEQQNR